MSREKTKIRLEPNPNVLQFLQRAKEYVSKMPEWKRGILEASSLATNSVERPPVTAPTQGR